MQADESGVAEMERATADLPSLAFVEIRFLTEDRQEDQSPEAVIRRRKRINAIADICHNLPGLLAPGRRDRLADGLRYLWSTANAVKRRWLVRTEISSPTTIGGSPRRHRRRQQTPPPSDGSP